MSDDDQPDVEDRIARLEMRFQKLTEDYNTLRHEVNQLEEKIERRL